MKTELPSTPLFSEAAEIVAELKRHGKKAFLIGGCVRDMLLGASPHDVDIATSATPEEIQRIFEKTYAVGASFGVVTVVQNGRCFEIATLREERDYMDGRRPEAVEIRTAVFQKIISGFCGRSVSPSGSVLNLIPPRATPPGVTRKNFPSFPPNGCVTRWRKCCSARIPPVRSN